MTDRERLTADLIRDEGREHRVYPDSKGIPTIGVGRNLRDKGLSDDEIRYLLNNDIDECVADLTENFPWFSTLNAVRQRAILNMRFNLGPTRFRKFTGTIGHLAVGNFTGAAEGIRASLMAKQTGRRAERIAVMIEHGEEVKEPSIPKRFRSPHKRKDVWKL
jgi:lysozyme